MRTDLKLPVAAMAALCLVSLGLGQVTPEASLAAMPPLPGAPCGMSGEQRGEYQTKLGEFSASLEEEIARREQEAEAAADEAQDQIKTRMGKEAGLSDDEIEKLKNVDNLSEAEQTALVEEMMDGKYNLSLEEIEKLKKMSPKGQEAWALAYAKEALANAQANPEQVQKDQVNARSMYELTRELKGLMDRIGAQDSKYAQQIRELEKSDGAKAIRDLQAALSRLQDEKTSDEAASEQKRKAIEAQLEKIEVAIKAYCPVYAGAYRGILANYRNSLEAAIPGYNRIDEIAFELTRVQTGVGGGRAKTGLTALKAIQHYAGLIDGIFKYARAGE